MFKGLKKSIIRTRIETLLTSNKFTSIKGGYSSIGAKIAKYVSTFYNGTFQSSAEILDADPEQVANIVAECYDPIMNIIKEVKNIQQVLKEHNPAIQETINNVKEEWAKWEAQAEAEIKEVVEDSNDIIGFCNDAVEDYLK